MKSEADKALQILSLNRVSIQKKQILCAEGKQALSACCKQNCNKNGFLCQIKGCKCKQYHKQCFQKIDIQDIQIILKRQQQAFRQIGLIIETQIQRAIDQLSQLQEKLKQDLQKSLKFIGSSQTQKLVCQALKTGKGTKVKGSHIYQLYKGLQGQTKNQYQILEEKINKCWDKYKEEFRILTQSLNDYLLNQNINTNKLSLLKEPVTMYLFSESSIIKTQDDIQRMIKFFNKTINITQIIFRASRDSFKVGQFHAKCNGVRDTLTIVETSTGKIFGGFTSSEWSSSGQYGQDNSRQSFVFQFNHNDKFTLKPKYAAKTIWNRSDLGPTFGGFKGTDICIYNDSNIHSNSYANIGHTYQNPSYIKGNADSRAKFSGTYQFMVKDYEVWAINFK